MTTMISFKYGRIDYIKHLAESKEVTPAAQAAKMIADAKTVMIDFDDREYLADLLIELGSMVYRLSDSYVIMTNSGSGYAYETIHNLKKVIIWVEMQWLSARRNQYQADNA